MSGSGIYPSGGGGGSLSFPILAPDGSATAPSYGFSSQSSPVGAGMFYTGAVDFLLAFCARGTAIGGFRSNGQTFQVHSGAQLGWTPTVALDAIMDTSLSRFQSGFVAAGVGAPGATNLGALVAQAFVGYAGSTGNRTIVMQGATGGPFGGTLAGLALGSAVFVSWDSGTDPGVGGPDLSLARLAAASLRQGLAPSAAPAAQTFTVGEASRPGTDNNIAGSSGTIRSGLGTGIGTAATLIFQTATVVASGTGSQTYATRLTMSASALVSTVPINGTNLVLSGATSGVLNFTGAATGAGGSVGTLANAPSAGDPAFWIPIQIGGATRFIPAWA